MYGWTNEPDLSFFFVLVPSSALSPVALLPLASTTTAVLTSPNVGMNENDLRPALLMLSSCHTELGKRARSLLGDEAALTKHHLYMSQMYLQKVYGTGVLSGPAALQGQRRSVSLPRSSRGYLANASNLSSDMATTTTTNTTTDSTIDTSCSSPPSGLRGGRQNSIQNLNYDQLKIYVTDLEHQVGRSAGECTIPPTHMESATAAIATHAHVNQLRSAKRKLEEEIEAERRARRKVEEELDGTLRELTSVKRGERHALELCKREVEERRKAEERLERMRERLERAVRERREAVGREMRVREGVGRMGAMFLRMAEGEVDVSMGVGVGVCDAPVRAVEFWGTRTGKETETGTGKGMDMGMGMGTGTGREKGGKNVVMGSGGNTPMITENEGSSRRASSTRSGEVVLKEGHSLRPKESSDVFS